MPTGIKIGIVEDEVLIAENLSQMIDDLGYEVAKVCYDFDEAMSEMVDIDIDLLILDINLGGDKDGIALAQALTAVKSVPIIFLTAFSDKVTVARAVQCKPSAYLVKPVGEGSLFAAIQNAIENYSAHRQAAMPGDKPHEIDHFYSKIGNKIIQVKWNDIYCISSTKNYVQMITPDNKNGYLIRTSLQQAITRILPAHLRDNYIQISRSVCLLRSSIIKISSKSIETPYGEFEIGTSFLPELKKIFALIG